MIRSTFHFLLPVLLCLSSHALAGGAGGGSEEVPYSLTVCNNPFEDISGTGTALTLGDDEGQFVGIGFDFRFFGVEHASVGVASNGYLTFGADLSDFTNDPIPTATDPNDLIAPFWDDLSPNQGGAVHYETRGSAPNRRFIAQWTAVPLFSGGGEVTCQAVLHEGSNDIEFHYGAITVESVTVGIENPDGSAGLSVASFTLVEGGCLLFVSEQDGAGTDLGCQEFDRYEDLTPNDTLTLFTKNHNPQQEQGFFCVVAVNAANQPVAHDSLIGSQLVVSGLEQFEYQVNPVDYRAVVAAGELTDLDADGVRDLDGQEYEKTAGELLIPRFFARDDARGLYGELVLIDFSGGKHFTTTADFLIYNDNEDQFSASTKFTCWDKIETTEITQVFETSWLQNFSGQNEDESVAGLEYGWFRVLGGSASSSSTTILDPAIYGVYIEHVGGSVVADLPFELCTQTGHHLPRTLNGDNSQVADAPSDQDCNERLPGRQPASLLVYPEFDNRAGIVTVATVTNVDPAEDIRVHFVYYGRFGN